LAIVPIRSEFMKGLRQQEDRVQGAVSGGINRLFDNVPQQAQFLREPAQMAAGVVGSMLRPSEAAFMVGGGIAPKKKVSLKVFRGETSGTDAGDFGKGVYFTGDITRAKAFGKGVASEHTVTLKNPKVFNTTESARLWRRSIVGRELLDKPQSEKASRLIDTVLHKEGRDGVVVFDGNGNFTATPELPFEVVRLGKKPIHSHEVLNFKVGPKNRNIEVIKNPTDSDSRGLIKEFRRDFPHAGDTPKIRSTIDEMGNEYIWRSDMGLHFEIEPFIRKRFNVDVNQNFQSHR